MGLYLSSSGTLYGLYLWKKIIRIWIPTKHHQCTSEEIFNPTLIWHSEDVHRNTYILIIKVNRKIISHIYLINYCTFSGHVHCPSSGVSQHYIHAIFIRYASSVSRQPTELAWQIPIACIQCWDTPDDGQWTCPENVEYFTK